MSLVIEDGTCFSGFCPCLYYNVVLGHVKQDWLCQPCLACILRVYINQRKAGIILSYAGQLAKIMISIIYTPIMLRLLGQSEYGLYQLVYSVVSYLSLLSLGFSSSYMRFYSRYKAQKDEDGVARLNGMFLLIFASLSVVCILCGCVMLGNIRAIFGGGLTDSEYATAKVLMALLVVNLALTFPNSVFACAITAHEIIQ